MRGLRPLALALAFATAALPLAASAEKALAPKDRQAALLKFQQDLASVLALRTEAQPLLGAALLARPLARPPETLTYHTLLERAARGDGAGPSVTWAQLADCDGKAGSCPNADAMASLKQQVPGNAAVWMLALQPRMPTLGPTSPRLRRQKPTTTTSAAACRRWPAR